MDNYDITDKYLLHDTTVKAFSYDSFNKLAKLKIKTSAREISIQAIDVKMLKGIFRDSFDINEIYLYTPKNLDNNNAYFYRFALEYLFEGSYDDNLLYLAKYNIKYLLYICTSFGEKIAVLCNDIKFVTSKPRTPQ